MKKEIKSKKENTFLDKLLILVYLLVLFVPSMGAMETAFTQWFYLALVNFIAVCFLIYNKSKYTFSFQNKVSKFIFVGSILFSIVTLLSFTKSILISESIVHFTFLINTLIAFFVFYTFVKEKPKEYFIYTAYILTIFLGIESYTVISHFIENNSEPRSVELLLSLKHVYGNRNILAASLTIKLFFTLYFFIAKKSNIRYLYLLLFLIGCIAILLVGARTAIYSLPIVLFFLTIGYSKFVDKNLSFKKKVLSILLPVLLSVVFALFSSLSINKIQKNSFNNFSDLVFTQSKNSLKSRRAIKRKKILKKQDSKNSQKNSNKKVQVKSIENDLNKTISKYTYDSGRKKYWFSGIETLKNNPILGVGPGNWKLIKRPSLIKNNGGDYFYPRRVHNDFLQVAYESGILGFVIFISFFGLIFYLLLKNILNKREDEELSLINLILFCVFIVYSLDSLINFPFERTPIQVTSFLIISLIIALTNKGVSTKINFLVLYPILLASASLVFLNFKAYKTSKLDSYVKSNIYKSNIFKDKYRITYNEIKDKYSGFPELNALGGPIEHSLAMIAYTEGKYDIAMNHLNTAIKQAPNQQEHIGLKAVIFELNKKLKNRDSSKFYAEKAFTQKPSLLNMYNILKLSYYREKDTISLEKLFNSHLKYRRGNSQGWVDKFNFYYSYKKDSLRSSMVLDTALSIHRNNKTLLDYKKHLKFK